MNYLNLIKRKGIFNSFIYIFCSSLHYLLVLFIKPIFKSFKINNNYLVFYSSPDYADNSLYLYKYFTEFRTNNDYYYIWFISKDTEISRFHNTKNTVFVRFNSKLHTGISIKALYYLAKSKYIFYTHSSPISSKNKKKEQIIINLWHGCGYKNTRDKSQNSHYSFDYALVPGKIFIDVKANFWKCNPSIIIPIGYPRYDAFFDNNQDAKKFIQNICGHHKFVFWMPTFRNTGTSLFPEDNILYNFDLPLLDSIEQLDSLNTFCNSSDIIIFVKRHPLQLKYSCEEKKYSNIVFIDNDDLIENNVELYSMLKYSDALISDYSSIAVDYLLLDKPIGFVLSDLEEYKQKRGFVFENPLEYMPGMHIYNFDDFLDFIKSIALNQDQYKSERHALIKELHNTCNNYCERIYKWLKTL